MLQVVLPGITKLFKTLKAKKKYFMELDAIKDCQKLNFYLLTCIQAGLPSQWDGDINHKSLAVSQHNSFIS